MQDLNDMALFAKVVEHGSYTAAARALGVPISKISRRVSELEKRLDVRLLRRTTRKISVTDIGHSYYQHCAALIAEAAAAQDVIDRTRSVPQGLIRVSCPVPLIHSGVGSMVARFLLQNPRVQINIEATGRRVSIIEEGFDLAIRVRTPPLEDSGLVIRELGESLTLLVASPALLDRLGRPTDPNALSDLPTLSMSSPGDQFVWEFSDRQGAAMRVTHTPRLATDDFVTLREAALKGVGIGYLPQFVVQSDIDARRLEVVLPDFSLPAGLIHAVFPSRRGMVPAVRSFIEALAEEYKK